MPRTSDSKIPPYRKHKGTGQAVVWLNGRDVYLGRHGSKASRAEYEKIIGLWLANGRHLPTADSASDITVVEVVAKFWQHARRYYVKHGKPTSEQHRIKAAMRPLRRLFGELPAVQFGPIALQTVRDDMIATGLCRNVVNGYVHIVRRVFRWAAANELVPGTVYQALRAVPGLAKGRSAARETAKVRPVPDEHVDAVKPFVRPAVWAMIELQQLTGMRSGEVRTMRGIDIDTTGAIWEYVPVEHKTEHHDETRLIPLGPRAQDIIRPFLQTDLEAFLFESQQGRCYGTDSYRRTIARACKRAEVPAWHPHRLRHSAATRIRKQFGFEAAQVLLGQRTGTATEVYAEQNRDKAIAIMQKIG